jgi:hypothetical protein
MYSARDKTLDDSRSESALRLADARHRLAETISLSDEARSDLQKLNGQAIGNILVSNYWGALCDALGAYLSARKHGNRKEEALSLTSIAASMLLLAPIDDAFALLSIAKSIAEQEQDFRQMTRIHNAFGIGYGQSSAHNAADEHFALAQVFAESDPTGHDRCRVLVNQGNLWNIRAQTFIANKSFHMVSECTARGIKTTNRAIDAARVGKHDAAMIDALIVLGLLETSAGNRARSMEIFQTVWDHAPQVGRASLLPTIGENLGRLHFEDHNYPLAKSIVDLAIVEALSSSPSPKAEGLYHLQSEINRRLGHAADADDSSAKAILAKKAFDQLHDEMHQIFLCIRADHIT